MCIEHCVRLQLCLTVPGARPDGHHRRSPEGDPRPSASAGHGLVRLGVGLVNLTGPQGGNVECGVGVGVIQGQPGPGEVHQGRGGECHRRIMSRKVAGIIVAGAGDVVRRELAGDSPRSRLAAIWAGSAG